MREYKIATAWKVFVCFVACSLIALLGFFAFVFLTKETTSFLFDSLVGLISVSTSTFLSLLIVDVFKAKLIISTDSIQLKSFFINRQLSIGEIKGYSIQKEQIILHPQDTSKKRIAIPTYWKNFNEIKNWIYSSYLDLEKESIRIETQEILKNQHLASSQKKGERKLKQAKRIVSFLNSIGFLSSLWLLVFPKPYLFTVFLCVSVPLFCLLLIIWSKGLIRINDKKGSASPSLLICYLTCCFALTIRAFTDFDIQSYQHLWLPFLGIVGTFATLYFWNTKKNFSSNQKKSNSDYLIPMICFLSYAFSTVILLNCTLKQKNSETYNVLILNKEEYSGGRGTSSSFNVTVSPWGKRLFPNSISVSSSVYQSHAVGDSISLNLSQGYFNIPWVKLSSHTK